MASRGRARLGRPQSRWRPQQVSNSGRMMAAQAGSDARADRHVHQSTYSGGRVSVVHPGAAQSAHRLAAWSAPAAWNPEGVITVLSGFGFSHAAHQEIVLIEIIA